MAKNGLAKIGLAKVGHYRMPVLSAWMTRCATWSMSKFQVKSESRTALLRVLENQLRVNCVTTAWTATRHREECDRRANLVQVLDNATTDGNALGYVKLSKKGECEIEDDEEHQVSAVSKMPGDEWKRLSDKAKEPCQKKYEAVKAQYDRDPAIFLANGAKEKAPHRCGRNRCN